MGGGREDGRAAAEEDRTAAEEDTLPVQQCGLPGGAVARPAPGRAPQLTRRRPVACPAQTAVAVQQVGRQQSVVGVDICKIISNQSSGTASWSPAKTEEQVDRNKRKGFLGFCLANIIRFLAPGQSPLVQAECFTQPKLARYVGLVCLLIS